MRNRIAGPDLAQYAFQRFENFQTISKERGERKGSLEEVGR